MATYKTTGKLDSGLFIKVRQELYYRGVRIKALSPTLLELALFNGRGWTKFHITSGVGNPLLIGEIDMEKKE